MRIVGGEYKSRVLFSFDGDSIRPTSDKVRESIFNILQNKIYGVVFLDLFCGTGAMGIEALSRGAKQVVFNDLARDSVALTKKNLSKLGVTDGVKVVSSDAITLLKTTDQKFDVVYIDPPYKSDLGKRALEVVERVLGENGIAVFEDEKPCDFIVDGLEEYDRRKYGRVHLTFFIRK